MVARIRARMPRKTALKHLLTPILLFLRWLLWLAIVANITVELAEVYLQKDIHHLAMSAIFFLLANLQISISRLLVSIEEVETAKQFFFISIFMICAAIIEIIDLGVDRFLTEIANSQFTAFYKFISIAEFLLGTFSTMLAGYSLDRFFVLIKRKASDLVWFNS